MDPTRMQPAVILPHARVREHRERLDDFLGIARHGLEALYRQVAGMGYCVLLTDARGVTVDFIGDLQLDTALRRAGLYLGSDWSEHHAGTCGVGTAIATGQALTVHQGDHFDATHIPLTCTTSPVHDPSGRLTAVLDISALRSPAPKASQALAVLPASRVERFVTAADGQAQIRVEVFQGEHSLCRDNTKLGEYTLQGIPAATAGEESIDVRFTYDLNGILEVDMTIVSTGHTSTLVIERSPGRMSPQQVEQARVALRGLKFHPRESLPNTTALARATGVVASQVGADEYVIDAPPLPKLMAQLTGWLADQGHELTDLRAGAQRLEDVFRRLTAERAAEAGAGGDAAS